MHVCLCPHSLYGRRGRGAWLKKIIIGKWSDAEKETNISPSSLEEPPQNVSFWLWQSLWLQVRDGCNMPVITATQGPEHSIYSWEYKGINIYLVSEPTTIPGTLKCKETLTRKIIWPMTSFFYWWSKPMFYVLFRSFKSLFLTLNLKVHTNELELYLVPVQC